VVEVIIRISYNRLSPSGRIYIIVNSSSHALTAEFETFLSNLNPWWHNHPAPRLPSFQRWLFAPVLQRLTSGMAPITAIRGPRQVGKTTLQQQIIQHLIQQEHIAPKRIFRIQFDMIPLLAEAGKTPILHLCNWFQQHILQGATFNEYAHQGEPVFLFLDEVQNIKDWAAQLKSLVDHNDLRVLLTGSSALRIKAGQDSLAGRISTFELNTLLLREIAALRGWGTLEPILPFSNGIHMLKELSFWQHLREYGQHQQEIRTATFTAFAERGGYPIAHRYPDTPWNELAEQLNESIITRVIRHDLRSGAGRKRDPRLLEALFRLCCHYAGQTPDQSVFVPELQQAIGDNLSWRSIQHSLQYLNDSLLIRTIEPLEIRLKKQGQHPSKICLCDHSLRASWLQEGITLTPQALQAAPELSDLAGHIAESIAGYFLRTLPGLEVAWFPKRSTEPEVDMVITIGLYRIPIEIKYRRRIDGHRDTLGLRSFLEKTVYNAPFGILVTLTDNVQVLDPRIVALPLSSFLLMR
jgi:predicted AAA+ superfamily ATPase